MFNYDNTDYKNFRIMLNKFISFEESKEVGFEAYGEIDRSVEDFSDIVDVIELKGADNQKITFVFANGEFCEWY